MKTKVRIEGGRELDQALHDLVGATSSATGKRAVVQALLRGAAVIHAPAQAKAPVRHAGAEKTFKDRTGAERVRRRGTLRALVNIGRRLTRNQARQARKQGKNDVEVYVGTRDRAAILAEGGTVDAAPQPFLRPAWDANKMRALDIIIDALRELIAKAMERAVRRAARQAKKRG